MTKSFQSQKSAPETQNKQRPPIHFSVPKPKANFKESSVNPCFDCEIQQNDLELGFSDLCESGSAVSRSGMDDLAQVNQYCWHGTRNLAAPIDILVLGDGPRDTILTLAEQLADNPDARITYFEPNEKILEHTKRRLQIRAEKQDKQNLTENIDFRTVLPVPEKQRFDYISFQALFFENETFARIRSLLNDDGVLGLQFRGEVAHAPQKNVHDMMEIVNRSVDDIQEQVRNAVLILKHLPKSHPIVQNGLAAEYARDQVRLYLDFIKPGHRSFALSHLVEWLTDHRLRLARFQPHMQVFLNPGMYPTSLPRSITRHLESLPRLNQIAFAELFWGNIDKFGIYVFPESSQNGQLDLMDSEIIPCFSDLAKKQNFDSMAGNPALWLAKTPNFRFDICGKTVSVGIKYDRLVADFLSRIDDRTTVRSITDALAEKHGAEQEQIIRHCISALLNFIETGVIVFHKKQTET